MSRADDYRRCAAAGMSQSETARELGVSESAVRLWAKRNGVEFRDGRRKQPSNEPEPAS